MHVHIFDHSTCMRPVNYNNNCILSKINEWNLLIFILRLSLKLEKTFVNAFVVIEMESSSLFKEFIRQYYNKYYIIYDGSADMTFLRGEIREKSNQQYM